MSLMYLEDYLELVSFLPQEFCDHLTKVRELDLETSNRRDSIEKMKEKVSPELFVKGRSGRNDLSTDQTGKEPLTSAEKLALNAEISAEYDKIVQLGVEKVRIVSGLEELMLRYNRRLMADTEKFKMELEADNPGITENLEARAEQDMQNLRDNVPLRQSPQEIRVPSSRRIADMGIIMAMQRQKQVGSKNAFNTPSSSANENASQRRLSLVQNNQNNQNNQNQNNQNNQNSNHGTNMLARAASQAIAATQNLPTGRRTASLKASYEASVRDTPTNLSRDQSIDRVDAPALPTSSAAAVYAQHNERRKRQSHRKIDKFADDEESEDPADGVDEDNKLYCFCKQPSAGFMIACDSPRCAIEWFHGSCVGVTGNSGEVGGKWFCPNCRNEIAKERERRLKINRQGYEGTRGGHEGTRGGYEGIRGGHEGTRGEGGRGEGGMFRAEAGATFRQDPTTAAGKLTANKKHRRPGQ